MFDKQDTQNITFEDFLVGISKFTKRDLSEQIDQVFQIYDPKG